MSTVRTEPSKPSNVLEFLYPQLFSKCSRMFSKRNVLKMPLFWPVYWHYSRKEFNKFDHPTTSGNNPNAYLTVCVPRKKTERVTLTSGAKVVPKRKQPMAAFDINYPSAAFGSLRGNSAPPCAFDSHFRPCCV